MSARKPAADSQQAYRADLAYIHDVGFGGFATGASRWLLDYLRSHRITTGKVVDLGCGSGIWAKALHDAGFDVLGVDISAAMIEIARNRVPQAEFRNESFLTTQLPSCVAVTSIGEIFNYLFDERNSPRKLQALFRRVFEALAPRGFFVFDVALIGREPTGRRRSFTEGEDWACLFEAEEDPKRQTLTRRITTFRRHGRGYRRDEETHRLRLYDRSEIESQLRSIGFRVRTVNAYGETRFPVGYAGFIARKP